MYFEPEVVIGSVPIVSVHSFYLLCSEFPTHGRDAGFKTESLNNFFGRSFLRVAVIERSLQELQLLQLDLLEQSRPQSDPTAAEHQSVAAVFSPRMLSPSRMMTPAPRKPILETTWAANL
jgi:hypothetical protein